MYLFFIESLFFIFFIIQACLLYKVPVNNEEIIRYIYRKGHIHWQGLMEYTMTIKGEGHAELHQYLQIEQSTWHKEEE